jgi:hypothetical protein
MFPKLNFRIKLIMAVIVGLIAIAWNPGVLVAGEPAGAVFTLARGAFLPAVASLPGSDRFLVVWDMGLVSLDGSHLRAQFVDSAGQPIGPDFAPTSPGPGKQGIPAVTANPEAGEFLVTWWDGREQWGDIYGQRLAADGSLVGGDFLIARAANFENWPPAVAYNPVSDEYLVVWYQDRDEAGGSNVYGQRVSDEGVTVGDVFLVNSEGSQVRPAVAANSATGEYLVVWSNVESGLSLKLFGQRLTSRGERVGATIAVGQGDKPAVTYNSISGEYLVVWADGFAQAARVRFTGSVIGGIALSEPGGSKNFSDVASDTSGGYLAVWDAPAGDDLTVVMGRELSSLGEPHSIQWALSDPSGQNISYPALAYNPQADAYLVVWDVWVAGQSMVQGRLYRLPPTPPPALINGDFEGGFYIDRQGRSVANGWAIYAIMGYPSFAGERFTVHSGQWAYKISSYAPFSGGLIQTVQVQPGRTYRVTAWYQLYPPGDGVAILIIRDKAHSERWAADSWPGVWRPLSQQMTVTTDHLTIFLQGTNGPDPNTNVYFDDVTVELVGSP